MRFTEFSFIIIALTSINVYFQAKKGYRQGLSKTLIRLSIIVFCAFAAAALAMLAASLAEKPLMDLFKETDAYYTIEETLGSGIDVLSVLFNMLFPMLAYLPVFFVLKLICDLIVSIIYKAFTKESRGRAQNYFSESEDRYVKENRGISAAVGVFVGFILSAILFMPFVGSVKTANHLIVAVDRLVPDIDIADSEVVEEIDYYADDASVTVFYVCVDKLLFDLSTTTKFEGDYTNLDSEISAIEDIRISDLQKLLSSLNEMNTETAEEISDLLDKSDKSVILRQLILSCVKDSSEAWMNHETYMGLERPTFDQHAAFDVFMDEIFYALSNSDYDTIRENLDTVVDIGLILGESRYLFASGDYDTMMLAMAGNGLLNKIKAALETNDNMRNVAYAVDEVVMSMVANEVTNGETFTKAQRERLYEEIADIVSSTAHLKDSPRTSAMMKYVQESFDDYGITIPAEMNSSIVSVLITECDGGSIDYDAIDELFSSYADSLGMFQ